jgi:hypothetical protein
MVVGSHPGMNIGMGTIARRVAVDDGLPQHVHGFRHLHSITGIAQLRQRIEEGGKDGEIGGGARIAGVGGEVEQHHGDLALGARRVAQPDQPFHPLRQDLDALGLGLHVSRPLGEGGVGAAAEDEGPGGAVEFGDSDHHGRLDRHQPLSGGLPLLQGLEFHGQGRDVGHIQSGEDLLSGLVVVVGGPPDQGKAGERDHGVHQGLTITDEEALDGGSGIEPTGEGGNDLQAALLQGLDHAVVMRRVTREHIGAHQQQAHPAPGGTRRHRHPGQILADPAPKARMIEADLGILHGGWHLE